MTEFDLIEDCKDLKDAVQTTIPNSKTVEPSMLREVLMEILCSIENLELKNRELVKEIEILKKGK